MNRHSIYIGPSGMMFFFFTWIILFLKSILISITIISSALLQFEIHSSFELGSRGDNKIQWNLVYHLIFKLCYVGYFEKPKIFLQLLLRFW